MTVLGIIASELDSIGVPYEFMRWTSEQVPDPYWIGEYTETPTVSEDGFEEGTIILTGTTSGSWLDLEKDKKKIKRHFPSIHGLRRSTDTGAVAIFYGNSFPVDTGTANLKRMQINLQVKEWRDDQ